MDEAQYARPRLESSETNRVLAFRTVSDLVQI